MGAWRFLKGAAQFTLGARYYERTTGDRRANLQRSIECFTKALRFYTAEAAPLDYAVTQNNLGIATGSFRAGTGGPT
jgi:hypothetical protein